MATGLTISGDKQLLRAMKALPKAAKKIIRKSLRSDAKALKGQIKTNAQRIHQISGGLASAKITVKAGKRSRTSVSVLTIYGADWNSEGGKRKFYPAKIELGHEATDGQFIAPQPFVRPAIDNMRGKHTSNVKRDLRTGLINNPPKG